MFKQIDTKYALNLVHINAQIYFINKKKKKKKKKGSIEKVQQTQIALNTPPTIPLKINRCNPISITKLKITTTFFLQEKL